MDEKPDELKPKPPIDPFGQISWAAISLPIIGALLGMLYVWLEYNIAISDYEHGRRAARWYHELLPERFAWGTSIGAIAGFGLAFLRSWNAGRRK